MIKEVDFHKRLDDFKQNIKTVLNFTLYKLFKLIDVADSGYWDVNNIKAFFKTHSHVPKINELAGIMRRFDMDGDGRISF